MQVSDLPTRTPTVFASSAGADYIRTVPVPSQIGIHDGEASYTDGFPPLTFVEEGAGGFPPDGRDMNGVFNSLSGWARWQQAGGPANWNSAFSTAIGGYPNGAMVLGTTPGLLYVSTVDNNATNPNVGGAGWVTYNSYLWENAALTGNPTAPSMPVNSFDNRVANTFYADRSAANAEAAAQAYADANFVDSQGGTVFTPSASQITMGNGAGLAFANLNGSASNIRGVRMYSAGQLRTQLILSGADNLFLQVADPPGSGIVTVFSVAPSTQVVAFAQSPTMPTPGVSDNSASGSSTAYADRQAQQNHISPIGTASLTGVTIGGSYNGSISATFPTLPHRGYIKAWAKLNTGAPGSNNIRCNLFINGNSVSADNTPLPQFHEGFLFPVSPGSTPTVTFTVTTTANPGNILATYSLMAEFIPTN